MLPYHRTDYRVHNNVILVISRAEMCRPFANCRVIHSLNCCKFVALWWASLYRTLKIHWLAHWLLVQIYSVQRGKCLYAMMPDEMMKLPVTCVRFYPVFPESGDQSRRSHIVAASCKHTCSSIMTYCIIGTTTQWDEWDPVPPILENLGTKCIWFSPTFVTVIFCCENMWFQTCFDCLLQPWPTGEASGVKW